MTRFLVQGRPVFRYEGALFCIVKGIDLDELMQNLENDQIVLEVRCANCVLVTSRLPQRHIPTLLNLFRGERKVPEFTEFRAWQSRYKARMLRNLKVTLSFREERPMLFSNQAVTVGEMRGMLKGDRYWNGAIVRKVHDLPANLNLRLLQEALQKTVDNEREFIEEDGRRTLLALATQEFGVFSTEEVLGVVRQVLARHDRRRISNDKPSGQMLYSRPAESFK